MLLSFFIALLTVVLVLDCLFLLLLILIQLPKKEAGIGQAFGGGTTDALFGAGSGTALTKVTKYSAGIFFVITFLLAILNAQQAKARGGHLREALDKASKAASAEPAAPGTAPASNAPVKVTLPSLSLTNAPAAPSSTVPLEATPTNAAKPQPK